MSKNISFDNISLDEFKNEIDNINNMFKNLMKDKKIKKTYNKILKLKEKENKKITYNCIKNYKGYSLKVNNDKKTSLSLHDNKDEYKKSQSKMIFG